MNIEKLIEKNLSYLLLLATVLLCAFVLRDVIFPTSMGKVLEEIDKNCNDICVGNNYVFDKKISLKVDFTSEKPYTCFCRK